MRFFKYFIKNLYLCVFVGEKECSIYGQFVKNGKNLNAIQADFEIVGEHIDFKFNDYVKKHSKDANTTYTALLLNTPKQWALPVSDRIGYNKFGVNFNEVNVLSMPGGWSIFIPKDEIQAQLHFLNGLKIDLLYSPFSILYDKINEFRADERVTLYAYIQGDSCAMMVFKELEMKFGAFYNNNSDQGDVKQDDENLAPINIAEIDNIIAKEDDKFNALNTLSELSTDNDIDTFEDISKTQEYERNESDAQANLERLGQSGQMLLNIKDAISDYYKNPLYDSNFVEKIVIFDSTGAMDEQNLIDIISNELCIETIVFKADKYKDALNIISKELKEC